MWSERWFKVSDLVNTLVPRTCREQLTILHFNLPLFTPVVQIGKLRLGEKLMVKE
jgi:hypothetical protein